MKKRFLSAHLCLCMVVGLLPAITPIAYATSSIDNLKKLFPDGKYWNYYVEQQRYRRQFSKVLEK